MRLEESGIVHGNLTPNNILIDENLNLTVINFKFSTRVGEKMKPILPHFTDYYYGVPPEAEPSDWSFHNSYYLSNYRLYKIKRHKGIKKMLENRKTHLVTTWSLGNILEKLLDELVMKENNSVKISPLVQNLLSMCLNKDPNKRSNTKEILEYINTFGAKAVSTVEETKERIKNEWKRIKLEEINNKKNKCFAFSQSSGYLIRFQNSFVKEKCFCVAHDAFWAKLFLQVLSLFITYLLLVLISFLLFCCPNII